MNVHLKSYLFNDVSVTNSCDKWPTAPTDTEKFAYCRPNGRVVSIIGLTFVIVFLVHAGLFLFKHWMLTPLYGAFCVMYIANIAFCYFGFILARDFDYVAHSALRERSAKFWPSVDVFLPNCGEDIGLLDNAYAAISQLNYPNWKAFVLDDVGRPAVAALAAKYGFTYVSRPNKGEMKKAGNLRYAFARTVGEFILILDADFCVRSDFLRETIFYFQTEHSLAILQTPQYFELQGSRLSIQKGATYFQEVFHRLIQNFRNLWGASVCTGSCALYRRKALEPYGGAAPVERSEDINTGLSVLRAGWKIKYVPLNLAKGLSPETVYAFFTQQYRWCSGSVHLITSRLFWTQKLSLAGKASYFLSILYYISSGSGVLLFSLPSLVNVFFFPTLLHVTNYIIVIPAFAILLFSRALWSRSRWGLYCLSTAFAAAYAHLISLLDVILGDVSPWVPTGLRKYVRDTKFERFKTALTLIPPLQLGLFVCGTIIHFHTIDAFAWSPPVALFLFMFVLSRLTLTELAGSERGDEETVSEDMFVGDISLRKQAQPI